VKEHYLSNSSQARPHFQWYYRFQEEENGANSWFETFSQGKRKHVDCEEHQVWTWKSGEYATLFDLLMVRRRLTRSI
jgi:hypothetical protein